MPDQKETRREFIKKIAYIPPVILTLVAAPAFASNGSGYRSKKYYGEYKNYGQYKKSTNQNKKKKDDDDDDDDD